jgi:hypothetical protein
MCVISTTSTRELSSSFFSLKARHRRKFILTETLGEHAPSNATFKNWVAQFKHSDYSTCDTPRSGQSKTVINPEIINQIHELSWEDLRISAKSIAEQLDISHEWSGSIIHKDLDMHKLSAKWVPRRVNVDQKCQCCQASEQHMEFFGKIQMIFYCNW